MSNEGTAVTAMVTLQQAAGATMYVQDGQGNWYRGEERTRIDLASPLGQTLARLVRMH